MKSKPRDIRSRRGAVLVFVLALIVLLSVLAMRLLEETMQEIRHVSQFHRRDDLRLHAYSALEVALGSLTEWKQVEGQLFAPSQGWGDPITYSEVEIPEMGVKWKVTIEDETGKIPFGAFKEKDLVALFSVMMAEGDELVDESDGEPLVDCLLDWQDKDDEDRDEGAESDHYENLDPPYFTPNLPINSFEEFRFIKGFAFDEDDPENSGVFFDEIGNETSNFRNFRSTVSFHSGYPVNVNTAPEYLLRFLCGDDERAFEEMVEILRGENPTSGEPFFRSPNDSRLGALRANRAIELGSECKIFRIKVSVSKGSANFRLHTLVESGRRTGTNSSRPNSAGVVRNKPAARVPNTSTAKTSKTSTRGPLDPRFSKLQYPFRIIALRENENLVD